MNSNRYVVVFPVEQVEPYTVFAPVDPPRNTSGPPAMDSAKDAMRAPRIFEHPHQAVEYSRQSKKRRDKYISPRKLLI